MHCCFPVCFQEVTLLFKSKYRCIHNPLLMFFFRGKRGLAETPKKELAQTPVLISCADQWDSVIDWSFTLLSGNPKLKTGLFRKLWTDSTSPLVLNLFELGFMSEERDPLLLPASPYLSVFPEIILWFEGRMPFWTPLSSFRWFVEEPSCPPVHGFSNTNGSIGLSYKEAILKAFK